MKIARLILLACIIALAVFNYKETGHLLDTLGVILLLLGLGVGLAVVADWRRK